jgi:hypothetical protein
MGSHMVYKVYIKLYKIIGLVIPWPVAVSELCIQNVKCVHIIYKM